MWGSTKANSNINAQLKHGYDISWIWYIHVCVLQEYQFCACHRPVDIPDQLHCYSLCCFFWFLDFFRLLFLFSWLVRGFHRLRCSFLWSWGDPMSADASSFRPRGNSWNQIKWSSKPDIDVSDPRTGYSLFGPHLGIVQQFFTIAILPTWSSSSPASPLSHWKWLSAATVGFPASQ